MFLSWLRTQTRHAMREAQRTSKPAGRHATFRPRLEALEGRDVPSTLTVTSSLDYGPGSLRYEISQANTGDTIVFNLKNSNHGTITLTGGELVIDKSLTIKGKGVTIASQPYETTLLEYAYGSRIFEVDGAGTTVAISGLTLTGGGGTRESESVTGDPHDGYGGAILNFRNLTITSRTPGRNSPPYYAGGSGSTFDTGLRGNRAPAAGGAIANFGTMTVSGCTLSGNSTNGFTDGLYFFGGGGIYNAGTMTVSGSHVVDNSAGSGGGIYNAGTMTHSSCYVQNNSDSTTQGGGIYNAGTAAALTVSGSTFSGNSPDAIFGPYVDGGGNFFG